MRMIMQILAGLTGLYMILIVIRIMITWFNGVPAGKPLALLCSITGPYLGWFRRFRALRFAALDLSPILALGVLSLCNTVFSQLAFYGTVTLGFILSIALSVLWSALSFILGFFIVILLLRLAAYLTRRNVYSPFWRIIDALSRPVLFRIQRFLFPNRIINYLAALIIAVGILLALAAGLGVLIAWGRNALLRLPF
ncbi:MAG: YggT family protein [Treponema sp.]|jgi:YggT family protein|nr:YggT family protein [Treponema sp.]